MRTASRSVVTAATSKERRGAAVASGDTEGAACAMARACWTMARIVLE